MYFIYFLVDNIFLHLQFRNIFEKTLKRGSQASDGVAIPGLIDKNSLFVNLYKMNIISTKRHLYVDVILILVKQNYLFFHY